MKIGHVFVSEGIEFEVVEVNQSGFPIVLRTKSNTRKLHIGSVIRSLDTIVKTKTFDSKSGFTRIELYQRQVPVSAQTALSLTLDSVDKNTLHSAMQAL
jgi:hypothetical protein